MNIELKKIYFSERLSEETNAFTAELYVDGKKLCYVKNDGQGGPTDYHVCDSKNSNKLKEVEAYCKSLPKLDLGSFKLDMNLEHKIDTLFEQWLKEKDSAKFNKKLEKDCLKGICVKSDNGYSMLQWKGFTIEQVLKHPQGKSMIKTQLDKLKGEGKVVLNKNIPQELFGILK
jgi:hypothetical protein